MQPIPVMRELVPAAPPALPGAAPGNAAGGAAAPGAFTAVDVTIATALPGSASLDATWRVAVVVPTGLAATWRDAPSTDVILDSAADTAPFDPASDAPLLARAPARLVVRNGTGGTWAVPLVRGARQLCDGIEVTVTGYRLLAGSMREPTVGSTVSIAWRPVGPGSPAFTEPPLHPYVHPRLPVRLRFASWIGIQVPPGEVPRRVARPLAWLIQTAREHR